MQLTEFYGHKRDLTFHPMLSKNVHNLAWPVVLPPQGPAKSEFMKQYVKAFKL